MDERKKVKGNGRELVDCNQFQWANTIKVNSIKGKRIFMMNKMGGNEKGKRHFVVARCCYVYVLDFVRYTALR